VRVRNESVFCRTVGVLINWQTFKYNTLETVYLSTAMFILLSGT
jgi:hypothetical protein